MKIIKEKGNYNLFSFFVDSFPKNFVFLQSLIKRLSVRSSQRASANSLIDDSKANY